MKEFQNIELNIDAIQLFGKVEIDAIIFTSKGIFLMKKLQKINNFILAQAKSE